MILLEIFISFFKIGAFTLGGGYAMVPLMEREVTVKKKWIEDENVADVFAVAQSAPGVIAINAAIFIGYKIAKMPGAISAALGVILPSFTSILLIFYLFASYQNNEMVQKAFLGVRAGVVGLIVNSAVKLAKSSISNVFGVVVAVASAIGMIAFSVSIPAMLVAGAVAGIIYGRWDRG